VSQQLTRYFAAVFGLGLGAVWSFGGFASALTCLAVAGVCFGLAVMSQRGAFGPAPESASRRPVLEAAPPTTARAKRPSPERAHRSSQVRPRRAGAPPPVSHRQHDDVESAGAVEYGW
jgi:hypothetical protein